MAKVELKKPVVEEISNSIKGAAAVVLVNYKGISVEQDTQMRKELREAGVVYKVYKNTMMNFAFKGTPCEELCQHLEGTNALAVCENDATAPARILAKYAKAVPTLELVAGVVEDTYSVSYTHLRAHETLTMIRQELQLFPRFLPEKNFLENCLEASSLLSQTLLVCLIRLLNSSRQNKQ